MLIGTGGNLYFVDMERFRKMMFEPMPLIMPTPDHDSLRFFRELDFAPKIMEPRSIVMSWTWDEPPSPWKFAYLFPLGRKAYIRRR